MPTKKAATEKKLIKTDASFFLILLISFIIIATSLIRVF